MIKKNWTYILFVSAAVCWGVTYLTRKPKSIGPDREVSVKTFQTADGWGYDICINNTVYIHQACIPARPGRKGFSTEEEARMIGTLAISKMRDNRLPVILLSDLDSCHIR
ncbi:MAG: DUF4907 domain-containing protein [Bacteroidetes bacterium]|nr:DUF4907 domain-containing protein [Bacteroidota bacterium]